MDIKTAIRAFGALSQDSRLQAFRMLVRAGTDGMPAGDIARALDVPHNTMSSHLNILTAANLITSRRDGRSIIYSVDFDGTRELLAYLMEDCCQGRADISARALETVLPGCCPPSNQETQERTNP